MDLLLLEGMHNSLGHIAHFASLPSPSFHRTVPSIRKFLSDIHQLVSQVPMSGKLPPSEFFSLADLGPSDRAALSSLLTRIRLTRDLVILRSKDEAVLPGIKKAACVSINQVTLSLSNV